MRKINFLKAVLGVATAMLMTVGAFGQNPAVPYTQYDANKATPTNIDYVTLKTGGTTMGYYALPDPVYHPNYVAAGTLTAGFTWNWSVDNAGVVTYPVATFTANYAQITYPATGNYVVNVAEVSPAGFGGCTGSTTVMNTTVINPPTALFSTADVLTGLCGNTVAQPINLAITENIPNALAAYAFAITESVDNINALGVVTANVSANATFVNFGLGAKAKTGTAGFTAATPDFDYDFNSSALAVQNNLRTQYTYTLISAAGVTGTGIVSAISQKSDFLAAPTVNAYAFGAKTTVVFIVNPAPVTGPIYYVPNTYAY
jgi:hypothetical protein